MAQRFPTAMPQREAIRLLGTVPQRAQDTPPPRGRDPGVGGEGSEPPIDHEPGGEALQQLLHPVFQTFEREYKALPEQAWFSSGVSPDQPVQFDFGPAFTVPSGMQLWLLDYQFSVYRYSGIDAGDWVLAEPGRFSGVMGFDLTLTGRRQADIKMQLDPVDVSIPLALAGGPITAPGSFNSSAAQSFAATSGQGLSLLPVRREVVGPDGKPFTYVCREGDRVLLKGVIFWPVRSPIATIEARIAGYLLHTNLADSLINRMRPR